MIVQGIVYIGRLVLTGKLKVFKVERCAQVKPTATASTDAPKAKRKAAPKKSATASTASAPKRKPAKRSK